MGYFYHHASTNRDTFNLFQHHEIYKKALNLKLGGTLSGIKQNIVNHICEALSYNDIKLDDELIETILSKNNQNLFTYLHHFFWDEKRHAPEIKSQIKPLWKKIYEQYKTDESEKVRKEFLGKTTLWLENIEEFDNKTYDRIKCSIIYIDDKYYFIKSLNKHVESSTEKVANILEMLFEIEVGYDISRGILQDMVKIIYSKGFKKQADKICILHADKGNYTLRDLYKQNNKESQ